MKIITQAPTRIGLIGGGTDLNPFASEFGGKILSFAINLRHSVILEPLKGSKMYLESLEVKTTKDLSKKIVYGVEKKLDLLYAIINYFKPLIPSGFRLEAKLDGENFGGLGSSGAAAVSIIGAFSKWLKRDLSRMEMAYLAWRIEVDELGWICGKQDQLAAAFGGINLLTFGAKDSAGVIPLSLSNELIEKIKKWTVLFNIGGNRHSTNMQKNLTKGMIQNDKIKALIDLRENVDETVIALKNQDFLTVGKLLDKSWELKKKSNPAIAGSRINNLYSLAKKTGVLGGKMMGAGAGGHMFFFCPPELQDKLVNKLAMQECKLINFKFDFEGLKVRKINA
ncbi:hypothetical protein ACFLZ1_05465 [Patescibacteria group bacterium]